MLCDHNKEGLIDAIAEGSPLPPHLRANVEACADCHEVVEREQLLAAAIQAGIRRSANAEVPPCFLSGLRVRLAQEPAPARPSRFLTKWVWATAAAALLLAMMPGLRPRGSPVERVEHHVPPPVREQGSASQASSALRSFAIADAAHIAHASSGRKMADTPRSAGTPSTQLEVLIPTEERDAYTRFVSATAGRGEIVIAPAMITAENQASHLGIEPLQMAQLRVTPLAQPRLLADAERDNR
jgi:hypothetical protein